MPCIVHHTVRWKLNFFTSTAAEHFLVQKKLLDSTNCPWRVVRVHAQLNIMYPVTLRQEIVEGLEIFDKLCTPSLVISGTNHSCGDPDGFRPH